MVGGRARWRRGGAAPRPARSPGGGSGSASRCRRLRSPRARRRGWTRPRPARRRSDGRRRSAAARRARDRTTGRRRRGTRRSRRCARRRLPWRITGSSVHGGGDIRSMTDTHTVSVVPPMRCWCPYGQHDHVTPLGPVRFAALDRHPAPAGGDDVEEQQPLTPGPEQARHHLARRRLVRPRLGVLAAEEDRALEAQVIERSREPARCHRQFAVSRSSVRGVAVMASDRPDGGQLITYNRVVPDTSEEETHAEVRDRAGPARRRQLSGDELQAISQKSVEVLDSMAGRAQWLQTYVTDDKLFCVYIADDEATVQEHATAAASPATVSAASDDDRPHHRRDQLTNALGAGRRLRRPVARWVQISGAFYRSQLVTLVLTPVWLPSSGRRCRTDARSSAG